jgi:pimeloyl-ACP methyl ester carboxylesterase
VAAASLPYRGGAGEPLVLLHGFTDSWRGWTQVLPALSERHEVFAWSLPGHLDGDPWDRSVPVTVGAFADSVERQLDALGLERVHLAGNSLGGWLSLEMAARGRARTVVGVCPALGWEPGSAEERRVSRFFRRSQVLAHRFASLSPLVARNPSLRRIALRDAIADGRKVPAADALMLFDGVRQCGAIVSDVLAQVGPGTAFELGPIDCPVRILYGSEDRVLRWPGHYTRLRRMLPDAEWVRLDGLGHVPMWDSPEVVATAILAHTDRTS